MKKQAINQFEKAIHYEFGCWKQDVITRSETKAYVTFKITDGSDMICSAELNAAQRLVQTANTMYCNLETHWLVKVEDGIPYIEINVEKD